MVTLTSCHDPSAGQARLIQLVCDNLRRARAAYCRTGTNSEIDLSSQCHKVWASRAHEECHPSNHEGTVQLEHARLSKVGPYAHASRFRGVWIACLSMCGSDFQNLDFHSPRGVPVGPFAPRGFVSGPN